MSAIGIRLVGLLGGLFIAAPIIALCSIVALPLIVISPRHADRVFDLGLEIASFFADLLMWHA